ncbi:polysaccharide lyase 8 family protein [uncultured Enterococcus sp.]|uniref:polysaccharide lyase 8 family protein n=1 Tax=uncultured Enterococcus sp. TaxID=167972 RepID=UPI002AA70E1C|nr:polysaccharide lyase 8 family protein [uncultured Enterococcus sp.]
MLSSYKNAILLISCSILTGAAFYSSVSAAAEEPSTKLSQAELYQQDGQSVQKEASSYQELQQKWRAQLVSDDYDAQIPEIANYVQALSAAAEDLYKKMDKDPDRTYLWPLEAGNTPSADLTTQFTKLQKLTLAYGTKGTAYYKDPAILSAVESGLDFMITKKGYDGKKYHGNWWDWQIGIPQKFVGILMVLKDELPAAKVQQYTTAISGYVPDPYKQLYTKPQGVFIDLAFIPNFVTSGANRTDLAQTVLGLGILQEDASKIRQASESIIDVFELVTKGDGFYADGSFIQHNNIPYTGSYGNVLMKGVGQVLSITKDSEFELPPEVVDGFVTNVERAFLPLIYQGEMLPGVNGRSISRAPSKNKSGYGSTTMYNLLIVAKFAPADSQQKLKEAVKYWMKENPTYYLTNTRDYNDLLMTLSLFDDTSIIGNQLPFIGAQMYASMDRFVQRTPEYMLSLSLYSSRISSFEAGNKENKRGWHTADGMMYLYNDDEVQFNQAYWPTVDPYRLPGTTVDTVSLQDEISAFTTVTSKEKWVGGAAINDKAVIGMSLNKSGTKNNGQVLPMNLQGKKSWFILDGQVVALGAGITGETTATIETVVDNRLLNDAYDYQVLSNNGTITSPTESSSKEWLLLQSNHKKNSIGYYFPNGETVDVISEARTGTYSEINEAFPSNDLYTGNYRKFLINHGQHPIDADYAYVMLPGIAEAELKEYVANKPVTVLENSRDIQAVALEEEGYTGINVWKSTGGTVAGISSDKPVSLLKETKGEQKHYVLSDPTQSNVTMKVKIPKDYATIQTMSEGITYDSVQDIFTIDFTNSNGGSKQIIVE